MSHHLVPIRSMKIEKVRKFIIHLTLRLYNIETAVELATLDELRRREAEEEIRKENGVRG